MRLLLGCVISSGKYLDSASKSPVLRECTGSTAKDGGGGGGGGEEMRKREPLDKEAKEEEEEEQRRESGSEEYQRGVVSFASR